MSIPFTQYIPPYGKTKSVYIDMDEDTERKAKIILDKGYRFTVEELSTGLLSLVCEGYDEDISFELCKNDPEIITIAVRNVVNSAYAVLKAGDNEPAN